MLIARVLAGSSILALMSGAAFAQVTNVGTNRSEVQDNGRDNKAQVDNGTAGNDRNNALVVFTGNNNRSTVTQVGDDNAAAQRHQGDNNLGIVRQVGDRNSATLLQVGSNNGSNVDQYLDPRTAIVGDRIVTVQQRGNSNSSSVNQVLGDNQAVVIQGTETESSNGGVSTINQASGSNRAQVTMVGGSADLPNRSHIEQTRIDAPYTANSATVSMGGTLNVSFLYQVGTRNAGIHSANGTQNIIVGRSYGDENASSVQQEGYRNLATVLQFAGNRNASSVQQTGTTRGDRQTYVIQGGDSNSSTVAQTGLLSSINVGQSGVGHVSSVVQSGSGNLARVNMFDGSLASPNKSSLTQRWTLSENSRLQADVTLRGQGNESTVEQAGFLHSAVVDVNGGGVGTNAAGQRLGNAVVISQDVVRPFGGLAGPSDGTGHVARVNVGAGAAGNTAEVTQRGAHPTVGNDTRIRQDGQFDRVIVTQAINFQDGDGGAVANIATRGTSNSVNISQTGRNIAVVTQGLGRDSSFRAASWDSKGSRAGGLDPFLTARGNNLINAGQYGDRNTADVGQEGSDNRIVVWQQVGSSDNSIVVNQGRNSGFLEGFTCFPRCQFANDANASTVQSGRFNAAQITQYGSSRAEISQAGTGTAALRNLASIIQYQTSAEARIVQGSGVGPSAAGDPASGLPGDPDSFAGGARASEARIVQGAGALSARIEQQGRGQYALIDQRGPNTASILQGANATNATAIILQTGSGNSYNIMQDQPGQYTRVVQSGTNNSVTNVVTRP